MTAIFAAKGTDRRVRRLGAALSLALAAAPVLAGDLQEQVSEAEARSAAAAEENETLRQRLQALEQEVKRLDDVLRARQEAATRTPPAPQLAAAPPSPAPWWRGPLVWGALLLLLAAGAAVWWRRRRGS